MAAQTEESDTSREQTKAEQDVDQVRQRAARDQKRLDSGAVTSPKDLENLQREIASLAKRQGDLEDIVLEVMERRESLDAEVAELGRRTGELDAEAGRLAGALGEVETEIDGEMAVERSARDELTATVEPGLVADYEQCRERARGMGAARLNGNTCQGCHLSIPSVEAERIRKSPPGTVAHCDNCGCILVP